MCSSFFYTYQRSSLFLVTFLRFPVKLDFLELLDKQMHWAPWRHISFEQMVCTLAPLCTSHLGTENTHEVWFRPFPAHFLRTSYIWVKNGCLCNPYLFSIDSHPASNSSSVNTWWTSLWKSVLNSDFLPYNTPSDSFALRSTCHLHQRWVELGSSSLIANSIALAWSVVRGYHVSLCQGNFKYEHTIKYKAQSFK